MQKDLNVRKIQTKFQELMQFDEDYKPGPHKQSKGELLSSILSGNSTKASNKIQKKEENQQATKKKTNQNDELIFTKSDICRQVAKLKPYLRQFEDTLTSVQLQDRMNKRITDQQQNSLSELVIYLNKQLCERLRDIEQSQKLKMKRQNKEKEGWVYQVFYRLSDSQIGNELNQVVFNCGYIVLTQILQLFPNLTFQKSLLKININEVKRVKYFEEREYQVIDIRFKQGTLHVAFLNENQMKLFDRMLFLLKNMARTSSTRLFQNQLLKNIYSEY